jgi:hypothetical protein
VLLIQFVGDKAINPLVENIIWKCFENLGKQKNLNTFIVQFGDIVDKLGGCSLPDDVLSVLVNRIQSNYTDETAKTAAKVILKSGEKQYIRNAIDTTKALLPQQQPLLVEVLRILDAKNFEGYLLTYIDEAVNHQDLYKRMQFAITNGIEEDKVWQEAIDNKFKILIPVLSLPAPTPHPVSPNKSQAKRLAHKVIRYARDNDQNPLLSSIVTSMYLFANLDDIKGDSAVTRYLGELKKSGDPTNSENAKRLLALGDKEV